MIESLVTLHGKPRPLIHTHTNGRRVRRREEGIGCGERGTSTVTELQFNKMGCGPTLERL